MVTPEEGRGLQLGRGVWEGFGVIDKIIIALVINPCIWFTWFFMSGCYCIIKIFLKTIPIRRSWPRHEDFVL